VKYGCCLIFSYLTASNGHEQPRCFSVQINVATLSFFMLKVLEHSHPEILWRMKTDIEFEANHNAFVAYKYSSSNTIKTSRKQNLLLLQSIV